MYNDHVPKIAAGMRACPEVFRQFGFTLDGETAACELQIRQLMQRYPAAPNSVVALIRAEVIGQAEHFARFGFFPIDQETFIKEYVHVHSTI